MRNMLAVLVMLAVAGAAECGAEVVQVTILDGNGEPVVLLPESGPSNRSWGPVSPAGLDRLIVPESPFDRAGGRVDQAGTIYTPGLPAQGGVIMPPNPMTLFKNGLSAYFSSATGGVGFRIGYDRRLSPVTRLIAGTEFITYGLEQSLSKLGSNLPPNVTRVTLVATPVGLQRQFSTKKRIIPHIGFGAGPYVRFDHQAGPAGFYPGSIGFGAGSYGGSTGYGLGVGLPIDDFPQLSLTLGGYAAAGFDLRLGEKKDLALTIDGRYTLARFTDALGNPGDLSGAALAIGFGKYF